MAWLPFDDGALCHEPEFDGETYEPARDADRLNAQLTRVYVALRDYEWHTLDELGRLKIRCLIMWAGRAARDADRLNAQLTRVYVALRDHQWHTLDELGRLTGDPTPSVSARLRDLRKTKFGGHVIARRYLDRGLWEYRLVE